MPDSSRDDPTISLIILALLLLCVLTLHMPWLAAGSAALNPGAADLAEWLSLHPGQGALATALLLRLPFALLAGVVAFSAPYRSALRWLYIALVIGLWIAMLPPLEFFTDAAARLNPNFQQQFVVWCTGIVAAAAGFTLRMKFIRRGALLLLPALIVVLSLWGITQAYPLMAAFGYSVAVGFGAVGLTIATLSVTLLWQIFAEKTSRQRRIT